MTHRLYEETCAERWKRRKREGELAAELRQYGYRDELRRERLREEEDERLRRRRREDERGRNDDGGPNPFALPTSYEPAPSTVMPDPPSTIDPGGGSSGGGGASGDY
jgi:uncharacterized membrane protein YgcG